MIIAAPPMIALMAWGIYAVISSYLSRDDVSLIATIFFAGLCGAMILLFVSGLVFGFLGRIELTNDTMTLVGAFTRTVVPAEKIKSFSWSQGYLNVSVEGRFMPHTIAFVEDMPAIEDWLSARTLDADGAALAIEDAEIAADQGLGMTAAAREERLEVLRGRVRLASWLIFVAIGTYLANAWTIGKAELMYTSLAALVLAPLYLDALALANRGHVRVDKERGSRYPEILTPTIFAGAFLTLVAISGHGAFLDTTFWELFAVAAVLKSLLWYFIDAERLRARGGVVLRAVTMVSIVLLSSFWTGGSLYMVNRHLDTSEATWHQTSVIGTRKRTGRRTEYLVKLAPWHPDQDGPFELSISKWTYESLYEGVAVDVAVREGALGAAWVASLRRSK